MAAKFLLALSFSITILFLLSGCFGSGCVKKPISSKDKKWFDAYKNIDTLIFESNKGNLDTFIFEDFYDGYSQCNRFELGPNQYNTVSIEYNCLASHKRGKYQRRIIVDFYTDYDGPEVKKSFTVFDGSATIDRSVDSTVILASNGVVPTKFFRGVSPGWSGSFMKSFHWNMEFGIVQYSSLYGETFVLKYRN